MTILFVAAAESLYAPPCTSQPLFVSGSAGKSTTVCADVDALRTASSSFAGLANAVHAVADELVRTSFCAADAAIGNSEAKANTNAAKYFTRSLRSLDTRR